MYSQYDKSTLINRSQFHSDLPSMDMIHVTWTDEIINWLSSMQWIDYQIVESYNIATHKEICAQRKIPHLQINTDTVNQNILVNHIKCSIFVFAVNR